MSETKLPVKAPAHSRGGWQDRQAERLQPSTRSEAIALLAGCLALVRPVGMAPEEAEDWLNVAATSVEHLPIDILDASCLAARRLCTHHAQVVPAVIAEGQPRLDERRRLTTTAVPAAFLPKPRGAVPDYVMSQSDVDELAASPGDLPRTLISLGLSSGALVRDETGRVLLNPEKADG